jgi:hypothetical protein
MKRSFELWMADVDNEISSRLDGMISADLPDVCYRDWYDANVSPKIAAKRALKYAME